MLRLISSLAVILSPAAFAQPSEATEPNNVLSVRLASTAGAPALGLGGLGGLGLLSVAPPGAGLSYERAFGHLSAVVALDASGAFATQFESLSASLEPGLRWTFGDRRLSGPWVGVAVPLSVRRTSFRANTLNELGENVSTRLTSTSFGLGLEALAGWSFRFDNGFFAQVAAGPRLAQQWGTGAAEVEPSTSLGLRGFVALGAAF
ncbi:MAG: hypothetical protein JNJ54_24740 [Myxococcaceae bacterium]|nr:hypothetical protein [Myxococcaceae bacterium]